MLRHKFMNERTVTFDDKGYDEDDNYTVYFSVKDTNGKTKEEEYRDYDDIDALIDFLRQLSYKIDRDSEDVKNYLKQRMDYR